MEPGISKLPIRCGFITSRSSSVLGHPAMTGVGKVTESIRSIVREIAICTDIVCRKDGIVVGHLNQTTGKIDFENVESTDIDLHFRNKKNIVDTQNLAHLNVPNATIFVHDLFSVSRSGISSQRAFQMFNNYEMILTPSMYSYEMICSSTKVHPSKVHVTPLSFDRESFFVKKINRDAILKGYGIPCELPVILHVSYNYVRKNLDGIYGALDILSKSRVDFSFVKIGKTHLDDVLLTRYPHLAAKVFYLGRVPQDNLADLYNASDCFVFPSHAEGFGLPVLEAQACGCPVVTSNTTALSEILGPLCIGVNPKNKEEIAGAILSVINNKGFRSLMIGSSEEWIKRFSWGELSGTLKSWIEG